MKILLLFSILLLLGTLGGCADETRGADTQSETVSKNQRLENSFTTPIVKLPSEDGFMLFGIKACHVYEAAQAQDAISDWELLFKPAFYPVPKQCVRERLEKEGAYLLIEIGTQGMGAGGCCTTYAAYRTKDGRNWEIRAETSRSEWQPLEKKD